jgi:hypothetical protein
MLNHWGWQVVGSVEGRRAEGRHLLVVKQALSGLSQSAVKPKLSAVGVSDGPIVVVVGLG